MNNKWDAYIYGDINVDIVIPGVKQLPLPGQEDIVDLMNTYVGGGAALFALGLGKLGLRAAFQGAVGDDCYGRFIREELDRSHVDSSMLSISKSNGTGISISFTNEKDRAFLTYRGTNADIELDSIRMDQVAKAGHIHITGYSGSRNHDSYIGLLKKVKEAGGITVSFDVGWDDTGEWNRGIYELFPYIDVLFMNETEALHYSRKESAEEAVRDFSEHCSLSVVKLGKRGSVACMDGKLYRAESYRVAAVDTTGAGDSFNAGFVYGFLRENPVGECLKYGNACGAMSVTAFGGNSGFPAEQELLDFIRIQEER